MKTHIIEATQKDDEFNWGKFMLCALDGAEWSRGSHLPLPPDLQTAMPLLAQRGWHPIMHFLIFDLETGEGARFRKDRHLRQQLDNKHRIWVCPMMGPFLDWLSVQEWEDITQLPTFVALETSEGDLAGYRRG